jgi:hypothetical protein
MLVDVPMRRREPMAAGPLSATWRAGSAGRAVAEQWRRYAGHVGSRDRALAQLRRRRFAPGGLSKRSCVRRCFWRNPPPVCLQSQRISVEWSMLAATGRSQVLAACACLRRSASCISRLDLAPSTVSLRTTRRLQRYRVGDLSPPVDHN